MHSINVAEHHDYSYAVVAGSSLEAEFGARASAPCTQGASGRSRRPSLIGLPALARKLYEFGYRRSKFLPSGLFGEPAWYILLDLYASEAEGRAISATSASLASGAPATTGLRVIRILEDKGLICKGKAGSDRRRCDVQLTLEGRSAIEKTLRELRPMLGHLLTYSY